MTDETADEFFKLKSKPVKRQTFGQLLDSGDCSDVILSVCGEPGDQTQHFNCHKLVLKLAGRAFETILYGPESQKFERDSNGRLVVSLTGIDSEMFTILLRFVYMKNIQLNSPSELLALFKLGKRFQMDGLREAILEAVVTNRNAACLFHAHAIVTCDQELLKLCLSVLGENYKPFTYLAPHTVETRNTNHQSQITPGNQSGMNIPRNRLSMLDKIILSNGSGDHLGFSNCNNSDIPNFNSDSSAILCPIAPNPCINVPKLQPNLALYSWKNERMRRTSANDVDKSDYDVIKQPEPEQKLVMSDSGLEDNGSAIEKVSCGSLVARLERVRQTLTQTEARVRTDKSTERKIVQLGSLDSDGNLENDYLHKLRISVSDSDSSGVPKSPSLSDRSDASDDCQKTSEVGCEWVRAADWDHEKKKKLESASSAVERTSLPNEIYYRRIYITDNMAGSIIGVGGSRISDIRKQSGLNPYIHPSENGDSTRILTIRGKRKQILDALTLIKKFLDESDEIRIDVNSDNWIIKNGRDSVESLESVPRKEFHRRNSSDIVERMITVSDLMAGAIIGSGGTRIQSLCSRSGCAITVDKIGYNGVRQLAIKGRRDDVKNAAVLIKMKLEEEGCKCIDVESDDWTHDCPQPIRSVFLQAVNWWSKQDPIIVEPIPNRHLKNGEISRSIVIPVRLTGRLIGKSGCNVDKLSGESQCTIDFHDPDDGTNVKIMTLTGTPEAVDCAAILVKTTFDDYCYTGIDVDSDDWVTGVQVDAGQKPKIQPRRRSPSSQGMLSRTIAIPPNVTGVIIGCKGQRIKEIEATTGCALFIDNDTSNANLCLTGTEEAVEEALLLVKNCLEDYGYSGVDLESDNWVLTDTRKTKVTNYSSRAKPKAGKNVCKRDVVLPEKMAGPLIGYKGAVIHSIQEESGCAMDVRDSEFGGKVLSVVGESDAVRKALTLSKTILEKFGCSGIDVDSEDWSLAVAGVRDGKSDNNQAARDVKTKKSSTDGTMNLDETVTKEFIITNTTAAAIIGPSGVRIKRMKAESGAVIYISSKREDESIDERSLTVKGSRVQVGLAIIMLDKLYEHLPVCKFARAGLNCDCDEFEC